VSEGIAFPFLIGKALTEHSDNKEKII